MNSEANSILNNTTGIQNSVKRTKLFECLKGRTIVNEFVLLQETHYCKSDEIKQKGKLESFFSFTDPKQ